MTDPKEDNYSEVETVARREAALTAEVSHYPLRILL